MDVSILIVSYNTKEMTRECLRSIFEETQEASFEVILVDNDSRDGSPEMVAEEFPQVQLTASKENLGFGRANNLAGEQAKGDHILLLNSDTVVLDHAIDRLVNYARAHPEAGLYGGRTVFADGSLNRTCCSGKPTLWSEFCIAMGLASLFPRTRLFDPRSLAPWEHDSRRQVDIISGAFLLLTREAWERTEGFDTRFFMYGEDVDLCLRGRELGYRCHFDSESEIIHHGGASDRVRVEKMVKLFTAKAQLYSKHWKWKARLGVLSLDLWAFTRFFGFSILRLGKKSSRGSYENWRAIWSQRSSWHGVSLAP